MTLTSRGRRKTPGKRKKLRSDRNTWKEKRQPKIRQLRRRRRSRRKVRKRRKRKKSSRSSFDSAK